MKTVGVPYASGCFSEVKILACGRTNIPDVWLHVQAQSGSEQPEVHLTLVHPLAVTLSQIWQSLPIMILRFLAHYIA